jgi:hypothetical protein
MKDPGEALQKAIGKRILRAWYSNTVSLGDIYSITLLLDDGSELMVGYGKVTPINEPDYLLVAKHKPLREWTEANERV